MNRRVGAWAQAFAGICAAAVLAQEYGTFRWLWLAGFVLCAWANAAFWQICDLRARICFGVLGTAAVLAWALGMRLDAKETSAASLLWCAVAAAGMGSAAALAFYRLSQWFAAWRGCAAKGSFWLFWTLLMLGWLPVLLAYYPGVFGYDLNNQISQVMNQQYNAAHPLLHTLLVGLFYQFGVWMENITLGVLLFTLVQMAAVAAAHAYALGYLCSLGCPRWAVWLLTAFYALAPNHSLLAMGATKDVLFGGGLSVFVVLCHRLWRNASLLKKPGFVAGWVLCGVWMCQMRNPAMLMLAALAIVVLLVRSVPRRAAALLGAMLVIHLGLSAGLKAATRAEDGAVNEMLSIPAQQIARVYSLYGTSIPAGEEIPQWVPHADLYRPELADMAKLHLKVKTPQDLWGFVKFWIREGMNHPVAYLDAFLLTNRAYWYANDTAYAAIYGQGPDVDTGVIISEIHEHLGARRSVYISWLHDLYEKLFSENQYQRLPLLSLLIHPSTYTWLMLLALACAVYQRRRAECMTLVLPLVYLCGLLLGPCALTRYAYPLMCCVPVIAAMLLKEEAK